MKAMEPTRTAFIDSVWASLISTMVLAMAPGPHSIGMPRGVMEMSLT